MKIGIITLPFNWNYGGILQTYALQVVLKDLGHEPTTINRDSVIMTFKMKVLSFIRRSILKILFRKKVVVRTWATKSEEQVIRKNTDRFIRENIATTDLFKSESDFYRLEKYGFEAFVAGSDQVWRPSYSPRIENHFFEFVKDKKGLKRVAFAPSFGVDDWRYTPSQTENCKKLVQQFDAVSVREESAVKLCQDYFGVSAEVVLDPTLLLPKEKYMELVKKDGIKKSEGSLFYYVLDLTEEKKKFIEEAGKRLGLDPFTTSAGMFRDLGKEKIADCVWPPVTQWLRSFMDAEFIITDSFHGTAFSMIFNKPFISIGNKKRGVSRFSSILNIVDLESRLVFDFGEKSLDLVDEPVDYRSVNEKINKKIEESVSFLREALER